MKVLFRIVFCCLVAFAMVVKFQPTESVNVEHVMGERESLWNAVCVAMEQTNDPRTIDEVVFETRKLNDLEGNKIARLGENQMIIIPCQRNKWIFK